MLRTGLSVGAIFLAALIGGLLLASCGVAVPQWLTGGRTIYLLNTCANANDRDVPGRWAKRLQDDLDSEIALCTADEQDRVDPAQPMPSPPSTENARPNIDERLEREQTVRGRASVSLAWNTQDDLDLFVRCPNGEVIYYSKKIACQGQLDVDMNGGRSSYSTEPVEHVVWTDDAPSGEYQVHVVFFARRTGGTQPIPFTVEISRGNVVQQTISGEVQRVHGSVRGALPADTKVGTFTIE